MKKVWLVLAILSLAAVACSLSNPMGSEQENTPTVFVTAEGLNQGSQDDTPIPTVGEVETEEAEGFTIQLETPTPAANQSDPQATIDTLNPGSFLAPGANVENWALNAGNPYMADGIYTWEEAQLMHRIPDPNPNYGIAYSIEECVDGGVTEPNCWYVAGTALTDTTFAPFPMVNDTDWWVDGQRAVCDMTHIRPEFAHMKPEDACDISIPPGFVGLVYAATLRPYPANFHDESARDVVTAGQMLTLFNVRAEQLVTVYDCGTNCWYIPPDVQKTVVVDNVCLENWLDATTAEEHEEIRPDFTYARLAHQISIPPGDNGVSVLGVTMRVCTDMELSEVTSLPESQISFEFVPMGGTVQQGEALPSETPFLTRSSQEDNPTSAPASVESTCQLKTLTNVNLRYGPGLVYGAKQVLPKETVVGIVGINTPTGWYLTENGLWINSYPNLVEVVGNCANLAESAAPPTPVMPTVAPSSSPTAILVELPPSGGSGTGGSEDDSGGDDETPWAATATPAQWSEAEARAMWGLGDDAALTRLADAYFVAKPVSTEANATFSVRNPLSCQVDGAWIDKKGEYQYGIPPGKKVNATQATILRECPS